MPSGTASTIRSRAGWSTIRWSCSPTCGRASRRPGRSAALGLDNQGESCLAWDAATGEPLSPVVVWQDNRTAEVIERLRSAAGSGDAGRAGLPLDPYFSAAKLAWTC